MIKYSSFNHIFCNLLHTSYNFTLCASFPPEAFGNFSWSTDPKMGLKSLSGLTFCLKIPACKASIIEHVFQCAFM